MHACVDNLAHLPVELLVKGDTSEITRHRWACIRVLGEEEVLNLLCDRMGKNEAEVRLVLESYDRASSNA